MSSPSSELKSEILRAGAGAGKTTRLVEEFIRAYQVFLSEKKSTPRIVVTTFTRKATHELKERLLQKSIERNDPALFTFVSQKSKVHISTIHGVLALFIRQQGYRIGLSPDFKLISSLEENILQKKLLKKVLLANEQYLALLEEFSVNELLVALDFSKECFITDSSDRFVTQPMMESYCVDEIQKKLKRLLLCASQIESENPPEKWLEYLREFKRLQTLSWNNFFAAIMEMKNFADSLGPKPAFRKAKPAFSEELNSKWSECLDAFKEICYDPFFSPDLWKRWFVVQKLFNDFAKVFIDQMFQYKISNSQFSMSDLEILSAMLIKKSEVAATVFSQSWDYWMIDEYQDTSPLQVYLLSKLIQDRPQFVVGDPQQSIYLFRGARSEVFEEKIKEFKEQKNIVSEKLDNYRSRIPVLSVINNIFTEMSPQFKSMNPKKDWSSSWPACEILISDTSETVDSDQGGESVSDQVELKLALSKIAELTAKGVPAEKIAVLSRNNRNLEKLGHLARENGISYQQPNASGYFLKREIKDAASILKFLLNPHDNEHLVSCLRSPWFHIEDQDLVFACKERSGSLWKTMLNSEISKNFSDKNTISIIEKLKKYLELSRQQGVSQTLIDIFIQRGIIDTSDFIDPSGQREANIWKFISTVKERERLGGFHYLDFLTEIESLVKSEDEGEAAPVIQPQRVNFMTVHASKGLQFEHVIIIGLSSKPRYSINPIWSYNENVRQWSLSLRDAETRSFIHSPQTKDQTNRLRDREGLESERVFYVAMTRAKDSVTLIMNHQIKKQSWAEKLFLDLSEGDHSASDFSYRVRKFSKAPEILQSEKFKSDRDVQIFPEKFSAKLESKSNSSSVTSMLSDSFAASENKISNVDSFELIKKSQTGTDLHRLFESMKYIGLDELNKLYRNDSIKNIIDYFRNLDQPPLMKLVDVGHVEFGFEIYDEEHGIIRGQIDLWGKLDNQIWILDYKTGSTQYLEKAFVQLEFYAKALAKIYNWDQTVKINLAVLYPMQQQCYIREIGNRGN